MSGKANNAGIYNFDNLNAQTLYIKGKRFEDYINELVFEDQLEQDEITEIKLLLEYLDTTGLNSAWLVNNGNTNETLRSAILALQTKLANIDTTALTQSSVLTNDNRNSVLKTRLDTAEGDIDNVENKTRFITEASVTGTGNNTYSNYRTRVGPADGVEKGSALIELNMKNGPANELIGYTIKSNFNNNSYSDNESIYSHRDGRLTLLAHTMRMQATEQIRIGNFAQYGDGGASTAINIGGRGQHVNIGCIDALSTGTTSTQIQIGKQSDTAPNTSTRLSGNMYLSDARFEDLTKTERITVASLVSGWLTGYPGWILGFFSGAISLPYSDVWVMKDASIGSSKKGDVATSNEIMVKELYVVNKDVLSLTPKIGFYMAKADYSCTQLIGNHRTQVFEGEIMLRNNNTGVNVIDWALTGANDKCNVVNIGGNDGILIHQGKSSSGASLRIINSCNGSIKLGLEQSGTKGSAKPALEAMPYDNDGTFQTMTRIGFYPGQNQGTGKIGSYQLEVNQELDRDGIAVATTDIITGVTVVNKINANSINTPGTITGIDVVGSTSISAPTATAGSLVINANYTGNTDARLYKNADNKLMWNGAEVGAGGVSSGGITYMVNVASNITNPNPTPTETIMTAAYTSTAQRTITQAITANTAYYIAKYTTEVFDEVTNPVLTGLQQLNQYLVWNSQNQVGQIYGRLWFQATAAGSATLYQRTYASPVTTTAATLINGTPIPTPKGLYNIKFQRVVFPNINVVVSSGPVVLRFRVEGYDLLNGWATITNLNPAGTGQSVSNTTNNLSVSLDEGYDLSQTSAVGAKTALRVVLYIDSGTGTIAQTSAGGADLAAYSLIAVGSNTPALFRTMLYDGTNAKVVTPYSTTPTLIEYDLPIDAPYNVSAFASPTLSTDLYFIQPSGGHNNHAITLYFNEGSISHYHSTISPTQPTPTLAQVLNSGATASQAINMNTNKISGITTLEGSSNGNWNVKEITAAQGSGISVSPTNGSYAIANTGVISVAAAAGTSGITATTTNGAVVLQNSGVISVAAASVSAGITATTTNGAVTLQNSGIITINQGTGISVTTTNGVATISNTASAGGQVARDQLSATNSVGLVPNKLPHYAQNWATQSVSVQPQDIFVSNDGRNCVYIPNSNAYVQNSPDYGVTWYNSNLTTGGLWSMCGSMTGEFLYITKYGNTTGSAPNVVYTPSIYVSYNYGSYWSELTIDRTPGAANTWYNRFIDKIRCSSDGNVVMVSTFNTTWASGVANNGVVYISTNAGATWVVRNITAGPSHIIDCCMSANGAIMFAAANGVLGGSTDNGNGGIYRSFDFGATWTKVKNQIAAGSYYFGIIKCDATGRFLVACDQSTSDIPDGGQIQTSDDYGSGWTWFGDEQARGARAAFVSPGGNLMITAHSSYSGYDSRIRYSTDYGRKWTNAISLNTILGSSTIRTLASNHDGSVLLVATGSDAAIYRCVEERGKLELVAGSRDLTMTPAFGGGYTLLNNPTTTLWFSGGFEIQTGGPQYKVDFDFLSAGKIDLTQYNIRYEIDCYWSTGTWSYVYPLLSINDVLNTDVPGTNPNVSHDPLSALTNWTNNINNGTYGGSEVYAQTYNNRFFAGYFPGSSTNGSAGANNLQRQRTLIKGTLSLHRRPAAQVGITDAAQNARDIFNIFTCDNYSERFYSGMLYLMNSNAQQGIDYGINHQRINGTGIFAAESVWSYNAMGAGTALAGGVSRIGFHLSEGGTTTTHRPRAAHYTYRIYRERK